MVIETNMFNLKKNSNGTTIPSALTNTFSFERYTTADNGKLILTKQKRKYKKACSNCNKRHFSCDGKRPCENCINKRVECIELTRKQKNKKRPSGSKNGGEKTTSDLPSSINRVGENLRQQLNEEELSGQLQKPRSNSSADELESMDSFQVALDQTNVSKLINKPVNENQSTMAPSTIKHKTSRNEFQGPDSPSDNFNKEAINSYDDNRHILTNQTNNDFVQQQTTSEVLPGSSFLKQSNAFYPPQMNNFSNLPDQNDIITDNVFLDSSSSEDENNLSEDNNYYSHSFENDVPVSGNQNPLPTTEKILQQQQARQALFEKKQLKKKRKLERLEICKYLGPKGFEIIIDSNIDLLHQHFPLIPIDQDNGDLFNQEEAFNNTSRGEFYIEKGSKSLNNSNIERNNKKSKTANGVDFRIINLEKGLLVPSAYSSKDSSTSRGHAYILELPTLPNGESRIVSNPEWTHSLQYKKPSEIYSKITQPFLHTHGFTSLLEYIKKRFSKSDVIKICYDIAAIRPVFIASCINFQEEDMIFMEHCFQRTLLEYASFIEEVGNPTIVWRRTGQISYVNDEFLMLTGWTRQQLLGKMTFVIEILDDKSSLIFFKNFKAVCYSDYTGFVNVPTMKVLTPKKGKIVECSSFFIVKRDTFGLPTFTVGNFLPK